jgi:hypothetical protein
LNGIASAKAPEAGQVDLKQMGNQVVGRVRRVSDANRAVASGKPLRTVRRRCRNESTDSRPLHCEPVAVFGDPPKARARCVQQRNCWLATPGKHPARVHSRFSTHCRSGLPRRLRTIDTAIRARTPFYMAHRASSICYQWWPNPLLAPNTIGNSVPSASSHNNICLRRSGFSPDRCAPLPCSPNQKQVGNGL